MTRKAIIALVAMFVVLVGVAWAHQGSGTVTCTKGSVAYVSTAGTTVTGKVNVNGAVVATNSAVATQSAPNGTLDVPYTAPAGNFTASVQWSFSTGEHGESTPVQLKCSEAPVPTPPTSTTPPDTPPAAPEQPSSTPPAVSPPTSTPTTPTPDNAPPRRFGTPGHPTKKCEHGRRQLRDSQGRRFTVCRKHAKPPVFRHPSFTG
jgi:hypothetical protein